MWLPGTIEAIDSWITLAVLEVINGNLDQLIAVEQQNWYCARPGANVLIEENLLGFTQILKFLDNFWFS